MYHILEFEQFENLSPIFEEVKQGAKGDPYEYKKEGDKYFTRKKGSSNWILTKGNTAKAIQDKIFPATKSLGVTPTGIKPYMRGSDKGIAQSDTFEPYRAATRGKLEMAEKMKQIGLKINKVKKTQPSIWDYMKDAIGRKFIPNVIQLFDAKPLTSKDFTDEQKRVILQAIENSKKRNPQSAAKKAGAVNYDDYGQEVASRFKNERGSPSMWSVAWHTLKLDQYFAMATLLGQFSWKQLPNGHYLIQDKYDFKDPGYKELTGINRKSLEGMSIGQLEDKFGFDSYEAARVKGWVEHPDTIPSKSLAVTVDIDPKALA